MSKRARKPKPKDLAKKTLWERFKRLATHSEKRPTAQDWEIFQERVKVAEELPKLEKSFSIGTILPFRTWKILTFAVIFSVVNWALWGVLDDIKTALGGASGVLASLNSSLQQVASQIWGWSCVFPTPSEGPEACIYVPNIMILIFLAGLFISLLAFGLDGLLRALREDTDKKRKEDRDTIIAAVLAAIRYTDDYREAMSRNAEFAEADKRRKEAKS